MDIARTFIKIYQRRRTQWRRKQATLWARTCELCLQPHHTPKLICPTCSDALPYNSSACFRCGIPIWHNAPDEIRDDMTDIDSTTSAQLCESCYQAPPPIMQTRCAYRYEFPIDQLISRMKYQNQPHLVRLLCQAIPSLIHHDDPLRGSLPQALIPIPMYPSRQRQRGYNQANYIAAELGRALGIPVLYNVIEKCRDTAPQHTLSAAQRRRNLQGQFTLTRHASKQLGPYQHIALVDDVITTGATCNEAARCLLADTACDIEMIEAWAIARTPS